MRGAALHESRWWSAGPPPHMHRPVATPATTRAMATVMTAVKVLSSPCDLGTDCADCGPRGGSSNGDGDGNTVASNALPPPFGSSANPPFGSFSGQPPPPPTIVPPPPSPSPPPPLPPPLQDKAQTSIQPTKEVAGEEATDLAFRGTTSLMEEEEEAAEAAAEEAAEAAARERQIPGTTFLLEPMGRRTAR